MGTRLATQPIISISVFEDDPVRLVGLRSILERVPDFHLTTISLPTIAVDHKVDIVLLGYHSGPDFFDTMATLKGVRPELRIIVTGSSADLETICKTIECGAKGYVYETAPATEFVQAIHAVNSGAVWVSRQAISMFIDRSDELRRRHFKLADPTLTSREKQVLRMLVGGRSNKEIGIPLGIQERTVKAHVAKLMRKVGARNRIALSVHAVTHSLLLAH